MATAVRMSAPCFPDTSGVEWNQKQRDRDERQEARGKRQEARDSGMAISYGAPG
jgi:hypothetical protein